MACPPLCRSARASHVNQDSPHQLGADREEMGPIRPTHSPNVDEADVQLVDEGRRLKSAVRLFAGHVMVGEAVELFVDNRNQLVACRAVARGPSLQERSHCGGRRFGVITS